jgi:hypothetical protein
MQEGAGMPLRGLVLVHVQERCLNKGEAQRQARNDSTNQTHGIYACSTK